ncbi:MAG TPA: VWA domain-containing protein [Pyrinomonadaceae bacterium]|nr:VWA domain-containing protein [Pyrinomonadaceae bacterium]
MRALLYAVCTFVIVLAVGAGALAQSGRSRQGGGDVKKSSTDSGQQRPDKSSGTEVELDDETKAEILKVDTNLVTVPVIVSTRGGTYIPDMRQEEFVILEDGVEQDVAFFATVTEPFHVVLMIDTSASTEEKLYQIRKAANAFVAQLQQSDRVKLVSFDDRVREFGDFTSDRSLLSGMIDQLRSGSGTKLYDAMDVALKSLERIRGRKAIVIFTDGVDWHSDRVDYADNLRALEETGIIIYPIRYDTRAETERLARAQARGGQTVDLGTIFGGGRPQGTPTTFPGGQIPTTTTGGSIPRIPGPVVITTGPGTSDPTTGPDATSRYPDPRNGPTQQPTTQQGQEDAAIRRMLDAAYLKADSYLNDLSYKSGGKLMRADTLGNLPDAFSQIAAELRTQYSLGYYPPKGSQDGKLHKIQVRSKRKDVQVRARPAYRSKSGAE